MPAANHSGSSRRQFLLRAALLAGGTPALVAFLNACARAEETSSSAPSLKIASPDIVHKTEIGGVLLDVADADAVRRPQNPKTPNS